ncbi:precorrin-2 dehydrogenase/sirohydrochlorin ferrochelatase family protein [Nitrosophilus alvini]|uniref:precorrin-2 dehydrogenase/sirohydrochlorin ferrochelatase family protein n=1 Tax=Nitrosophilus alvini TaxID=2714855 RepID=UPI00190A10E4|nr:bifunctional precorrin-2 dehydrogenase/sirohydrochlorin ferrochelatase [Nitrosophilus alvini]
MSFFPALLKLDKSKILVIGGGKIAGDKIGHLLDFTSNITVIAPKIDRNTQNLIEKGDITLLKREYKKGDIKGFDIVIVAVDDINLQKEIYEECQNERILCNSVDSVDYCDFIFPSYIKRGPLVIAFSTSGFSPALAKYLRRAIEKLIPENITEFLLEMKEIRKKLPKGKERQKLLEEKAKDYVEKNIIKKDENV